MQGGCAGTSQGPKWMEVLRRDLCLSTELSSRLPKQMPQQRELSGRVESELQGLGHMSDLGQQARQWLRSSPDPQVAPLQKTMST